MSKAFQSICLKHEGAVLQVVGYPQIRGTVKSDGYEFIGQINHNRSTQKARYCIKFFVLTTSTELGLHSGSEISITVINSDNNKLIYRDTFYNDVSEAAIEEFCGALCLRAQDSDLATAFGVVMNQLHLLKHQHTIALDLVKNRMFFKKQPLAPYHF